MLLTHQEKDRIVRLDTYDAARHGPLLGVSDEGSAAKVIADAAYASAKASASDRPGPAVVGVIIDGERMTSAGEVPIGPDEYRSVTAAAAGRTYCTTNVGVRLNARLYQPLPEFDIAAARDATQLVEAVLAAFQPFIATPDGVPRRLTVRLLLSGTESQSDLRAYVDGIEAGRRDGRMAGPDLHRITFLQVFEGDIVDEDQYQAIERLIETAHSLSVPEVAIDADPVVAARRRLGVQGVLNVLSPDAASRLLQHALAAGVRLTNRYELDPETASRTVWTGLYTAAAKGLSGAKYGLVPLTLSEQQHVVRDIQKWVQGLTAVPAFYADTPLVTADDVYLSDRAKEALERWLDMVSGEGVPVVLVDCPDRITPRIDLPGRQTPRRLIRSGAGGTGDDRGIFTLDQIEELIEFGERRNVRILWSGGIEPRLAYELGRRSVFGIFTTSSTARSIPVGDVLAGDPQLPAEGEPTREGVRRVHALVQAGFLESAMSEHDPKAAAELERVATRLLDLATDAPAFPGALEDLDRALTAGWRDHWTRG